jgi:hypothetical protein
MLKGIATKSTPLGLSIPSATRFDYTESCIHEETPLTAQNTNRHRVYGAIDGAGRSNEVDGDFSKEAAGSFLKQRQPRFFRLVPMGQDNHEQAALRADKAEDFVEVADEDLQAALENQDAQLYLFFPDGDKSAELRFGDEDVRGRSKG